MYFLLYFHENSLVFYNFSEVGQNYIEQLVGGYSKKELGDVLIPEVAFLDNTNICAFADNKLIFFQMKEIPELIKIVETFFSKEVLNLINSLPSFEYSLI